MQESADELLLPEQVDIKCYLHLAFFLLFSVLSLVKSRL